MERKDEMWQQYLLANGKTVEIVSFEKQNNEYGGATALIDGVLHRVRVAKITPKKIGQFVAIWEKDCRGVNIPFSADASPNFLSVFVFLNDKAGVFTFPKEVLVKRGVYRLDEEVGKMAFRLYPPWDIPLSKVALQTQKWQLEYFTAFK